MLMSWAWSATEDPLPPKFAVLISRHLASYLPLDDFIELRVRDLVTG